MPRDITEHQPRSNVTNEIVDGIRAGIKTGRLAPGYRLVESELTREYGVSRGPIREALSRLVAEGLVEVVPNRGAAVRRMTREDVRELFAVREILEGGAAGLAARNLKSADHRRRLREEIARNREYDRPPDPLVYGEANERFHALVIEIAGIRMLGSVLDQLQTYAYRVLFLHFQSSERIRESAAQHLEIAEAILAGDVDAAEALMRRHIRLTGEATLADEHPWFR